MLLLMTLVVAMIRFVSSVRHRDQASVGRAVLLTAFVASTSQGMVDGLVVVPYTQLWYVLVVGVLCGLCAQATPVQSGNGFTQSRQMGVAGLVAGSYLAVFAAQTFPCVAPSSAVYLTQFGEVLRPRFWSQGFIGQDFFPADGTCPTVKP